MEVNGVCLTSDSRVFQARNAATGNARALSEEQRVERIRSMKVSVK